MQDDKIYSEDATERLYSELQRLHASWIHIDSHTSWRSSDSWDIDKIKEALKEGANPNTTITVKRPYDSYSNSYKHPLFWSLFQENEAFYSIKAKQRMSDTKAILKLFADYGADFNKKDSLGYTCFNSEKAGHSYLPICELIDAGANMSIKSFFGETVLHRFISNLRIYPTEEIMTALNKLLKTNVDINAVPSTGSERSAFGILCDMYYEGNKGLGYHLQREDASKLYKEIMTALVLHGADINHPIKKTVSEDPIPAIKLLPKKLQKEITDLQKYTEETKATTDYDVDVFER